MKNYWVKVIRNREEHIWLEVEAESEEAAKDVGINAADSAFDADWNTDFEDFWVLEVEEKTEDII